MLRSTARAHAPPDNRTRLRAASVQSHPSISDERLKGREAQRLVAARVADRLGDQRKDLVESIENGLGQGVEVEHRWRGASERLVTRTSRAAAALPGFPPNLVGIRKLSSEFPNDLQSHPAVRRRVLFRLSTKKHPRRIPDLSASTHSAASARGPARNALGPCALSRAGVGSAPPTPRSPPRGTRR